MRFGAGLRFEGLDYYPFGMQMPGREFTAPNSGYRYGFNGKENDNEVKGEGNQQDYGMRIYDPRLGRFLSVDPLTPEYPSWSPYPFAMNRPIDGVDLDGMEWSMKTYYQKTLFGAITQHVTEYTVKLKVVLDPNDKQAAKKKEEIAKAQKYFTSTFSRGGLFATEIIKAKLEIEYVNSEEGLTPNKDFYLVFGHVDEPLGLATTNEIGSTQTNKIILDWDKYTEGNIFTGAWEATSLGWGGSSWYSYIAETIVHELGHTAGLRHYDDPMNIDYLNQANDESNLMNGRSDNDNEARHKPKSLTYKRNHLKDQQLAIVKKSIILDTTEFEPCKKSEIKTVKEESKIKKSQKPKH